MAAKDSRIRLINEIISGIKVLYIRIPVNALLSLPGAYLFSGLLEGAGLHTEGG